MHNLDEIKKIFEEIDQAVENNLSQVPVKISSSNFYKAYQEIKKRWLKK